MRSVTRFPCAVVAHGRSHERVVLVRPRIAIPAILLCLAASESSSNSSLGPPHPAQTSAAVSHRRSASMERRAPGSVELVLVVVCSTLPSLRKYLRHKGVDELPVPRETPWYPRSQHPPLLPQSCAYPDVPTKASNPTGFVPRTAEELVRFPRPSDRQAARWTCVPHSTKVHECKPHPSAFVRSCPRAPANPSGIVPGVFGISRLAHPSCSL